MPPLIVIGGATATGKTSLALELAGRIDAAEIVSADSRQVYRGMDIGTAKATASERAAVPHHCLDLVDPDSPFSAADYQRHALRALAGIAARGGVALLVGGTGLYLRSIARGLPLDRGGDDPALRAELEERLRRDGLEVLVEELIARDREGAAGIDHRNPRRVVRALERAILSGVATPPSPRGYPAPIIWLCLRLEAGAHRARIEARVRHHFEAGLLDEAERLLERYPADLRAFSAVGYHEAFDVLRGRCTLDEAMARDSQRTWVYARRQGTWFRSEPDVIWLEAGEGLMAQAEAALAARHHLLDRADYAARR